MDRVLFGLIVSIDLEGILSVVRLRVNCKLSNSLISMES